MPSLVHMAAKSGDSAMIQTGSMEPIQFDGAVQPKIDQSIRSSEWTAITATKAISKPTTRPIALRGDGFGTAPRCAPWLIPRRKRVPVAVVFGSSGPPSVTD